MNPISFSPMQPKVITSPRFRAAEATMHDRFIVVSDTGEVSRRPDSMVMSLSISEKGDDRAKVTESLNAKSTKLMEAVKALKLPLKLQTRGGVSPAIEQEDNDQGKSRYVQKGFQGQFHLSIMETKAKLADLKSHASQLIELAVANDANFTSPNFPYSKTSEAARQALNNAAKNITKAAQILAKAFGVKISNTPSRLSIGVSDGGYPRGGGMRAMASMAHGGRAHMTETTMEAPDIKIPSPTVEAAFEILPTDPAPKTPA